MLNDFTIDVSLVFAVAFLSNLAIILCFARRKSTTTRRNDTKAVQSSHVIPVARIGGLSVMIALAFATLPFFETTNSWPNYLLLLLSVLPVFLIGFCEDLGFFSSPRIRLLTAVFSGAVFVLLFELWIQRTDVPGLDFVIQWAPIGIGFSLFLAAGINHGFNLIDGLNGLSSLTAIGAALSLAVISHQVGLDEHRDVLIILISAISGFLVFNFPFGKIFLGDGGAYAVGHILVWMAISILHDAQSVTPLSMLLIFFFPIVDTLLAIWRRIYLGTPISHPDRMHFHQLAMRAIQIIVLGQKRQHIANPLATAFVLPFAFAPMLAGVLLALDRVKAVIALLLFTAIFLASYKVCMWLARQYRRSV
jgi:UDP-GlcNAc:undecaprenyl-phosphate/decaprenyl-phosphate GlcNAc-1-phosphate transferase